MGLNTDDFATSRFGLAPISGCLLVLLDCGLVDNRACACIVIGNNINSYISG